MLITRTVWNKRTPAAQVCLASTGCTMRGKGKLWDVSIPLVMIWFLQEEAGQQGFGFKKNARGVAPAAIGSGLLEWEGEGKKSRESSRKRRQECRVAHGQTGS